MSDLQNGGSPADDNALFADVTGGAAAPAVEPAPAPVATPATPDPNPTPEPAIPPSRLREEADARRTAERERDELRGRLAALEQLQQRPQTPAEKPKAPDFWEDPNAFVQSALTPMQEQFQRQIQEAREHFSRQAAVARFGEDVVKAAEDAANAGIASLPPDQQARMRAARGQSVDPYGEMVNWHKNKLALQEVGQDPAAYKTRILEEALKDPEFQKRVIEAARGQAQQNRNTITQPPAASSLPSLNKVGAVALPEDQTEASDAELFASTTRRRRG